MPCTASRYHQFDFWVGDWDVFDVGSPNKVAHVKVDSILDGCVLREDYQGADGHRGQSFTIYDARRRVWHQTWVTNRGELLHVDGKFENGEMILAGKNQRGALVRGSWKPMGEEVRETATTSTDDGETWRPWFDLMFRPTTDHASKSAADDPSDDKDVVAALDTQYQDAVKHNDAATMDRILADDFVLVTSSGKVYSKSDLLAEARNARTTYEHQEDTEKTVRVWGDTAIVTAYLWEQGATDGKPFDHKLWFSDIYRRTQQGWRYVFAQSAYRPCETAP